VEKPGLPHPKEMPRRGIGRSCPFRVVISGPSTFGEAGVALSVRVGKQGVGSRLGSGTRAGGPSKRGLFYRVSRQNGSLVMGTDDAITRSRSFSGLTSLPSARTTGPASRF
jgi:hypothetical protein